MRSNSALRLSKIIEPRLLQPKILLSLDIVPIGCDFREARSSDYTEKSLLQLEVTGWNIGESVAS